jgi:hypothetical protein
MATMRLGETISEDQLGEMSKSGPTDVALATGSRAKCFDEISFGFPRLVAAGYLTIGSSSTRGLTLQASPDAMRLRRRVHADRVGDEIIGMADLVGAPRQPQPEVEDRSLGRLIGFEPDDWDRAVREHVASAERWFKPFRAAARVIVWWSNRKGS